MNREKDRLVDEVLATVDSDVGFDAEFFDKYKEITFDEIVNLFESCGNSVTYSSSSTLDPNGPPQREASPGRQTSAEEHKDRLQRTAGRTCRESALRSTVSSTVPLCPLCPPAVARCCIQAMSLLRVVWAVRRRERVEEHRLCHSHAGLEISVPVPRSKI